MKEYHDTVWDFSKGFKKLNERQKLDFILAKGIMSVKQLTDKFLIPESVCKNALQLKTSEMFQLMKENGYEELYYEFSSIMIKFGRLVMQELLKGEYVLNNFNLDLLKEILDDLGNYKKILKSTYDVLQNSDMNCEIMISDFSKVPSMEGIEIPKTNIPDTIYVDILNTAGDKAVGIGYIVITKVDNIKIGNKVYDGESYCYSFYQSLPFLEFANGFYKEDYDIKFADLLSSLNTGFNMIDLPLYNTKHLKYRILNKSVNEDFCKSCFRENGCKGKDIMKNGSITDKDGTDGKYVFWTDSTIENCKEFFKFDAVKELRPSVDGIYNLARYILYMYATKNRETEELKLPDKHREHKVHEVQDKHQKLPKIKSFEKWHDLPNIKITKYKGEKCDMLIHEIKGTHASPIPHERSGHWRHLRNGKIIWVRKCKVNFKDEDEKVLKPIYKIDGSGEVK